MNMNPHMLAGLVVGEGCFTVDGGADSKYSLGWRCRPQFSVAMVSEDRELLEALKEAMQSGYIYELDFGRYEKYAAKNWKPQSKFIVTRIEDLYSKVVPFFEKYPLAGRKKKAFKLFAQIVKIRYEEKRITAVNINKLQELTNELKSLNKRG